MKELSVVSGKGGTGKTTITAALAALAAPVVVADCDVDAPDLHLVLTPDLLHREAFSGRAVARIEEGRCSGCGKCVAVCRFDALSWKDAPRGATAGRSEPRSIASVDNLRCNGCGYCARICPDRAIALIPVANGEIFTSRSRVGPMAHARLGIAEDNSGKLVTRVRELARELARVEGPGLVVIDGPPGIGCPVIASVTGADLVLIVTEPTVSGRHDLGRIIALVRHFGLPFAVCVNKWDINPSQADVVQTQAADSGALFVGRVRYDRATTAAMVAQKTVVEYTADGVAHDVRTLWSDLAAVLEFDPSTTIREGDAT